MQQLSDIAGRAAYEAMPSSAAKPSLEAQLPIAPSSSAPPMDAPGLAAEHVQRGRDAVVEMSSAIRSEDVGEACRSGEDVSEAGDEGTRACSHTVFCVQQVFATPLAAALRCRICLDDILDDAFCSGEGLHLNCACRGEMAAIHRVCAERWFGRKGNLLCEVCSSLVTNVRLLPRVAPRRPAARAPAAASRVTRGRRRLRLASTSSLDVRNSAARFLLVRSFLCALA